MMPAAPTDDVIRRVTTDVGVPEAFDLVKSHLLPAARILLEPVDDATVPPGTSRMGGHPDVPERFAWPRTRTKRLLTFIAQIDLADCAEALGPGSDVPIDGQLTFFFDARYSEGLEGGPGDHDRFKLYYWPAGTALQRLVRPKPIVDPDPSPVPTLPPHRCRFVREWTLPSSLEPRPQRDLRHAWPRIVDAFASTGPGEPRHRIGGHPTPPQDDPYSSCCLCRAGISHDLLWPRHPAVSEAEREVGDWRLLLQLARDERIDFYPADDASCLFVCATWQAIRSAQFDRYWVETQGT